MSSESNISSYEGNRWGEITDKLVYVSSTGAVSPWIATSWQTEDNAQKYILHLKPGVTFSDGEPLNAAAVVDNITLWAKGDKSRGIARVGLFPRALLRAGEGRQQHHGGGRLLQADARVHPDAGLPRLHPADAQDPRAER